MDQNKSSDLNTEDVSQMSRSHLESIFKKLNSYLEIGFFSDITLVAGLDDFKMRAHKAVLCASSVYFETMLTSSFKEPTENEIVLTDINGESLKMIVSYCYKGYVEITESNFEDVLRVSHKYLLNPILEQCYKALDNVIKLENCIKIFDLTEFYKLTEFTEYIWNYIEMNFQKFKDTDHFCNLSLEKIKRILESNHLEVMSEEDVFFALNNWVQKDFDGRKVYLFELLSLIRFKELKPEFIRKHIKPLFEKTGDTEIGTLLIDSLTWHCSFDNEDCTPVEHQNSRKSKDKLLVISTYNRSYRIYCYTKHSKDLKFIKDLNLTIEEVKFIYGVYNKDLIILNNQEKIQLLSLETGFNFCINSRKISNNFILRADNYLYCIVKNNFDQQLFEKYNITSKVMTALSANIPSNIIQMVYFNQDIYFFVGVNQFCDSIWRYDTKSNQSIEIKLSVEFEIISKPVEYNKEMYALRKCGNDFTSLIKFNAELSSWSQINFLPARLSEINLINFNYSLTVIGKRDQNYSLFQYIPNLNNWIMLNNLNFSGKLCCIAAVSPEFF